MGDVVDINTAEGKLSVANVDGSTANSDTYLFDSERKTKLVAIGGVLGAIAASTCCILPLLLFSLGISGAWIGNLTALSPFQPIFITIALGFLIYGYWLVYKKRKYASANGETCGRSLPNKLVNYGLWLATGLIAIALLWPFIVPLLLY